MILNVSFGAQGIQLYESNEWVHGQKMTTIVVGLVWTTYGLVFVFLKAITDYKLMNSSDITDQLIS